MRCLCPFCLGELPGNPGQCVKCRHCGSDVHWGAGKPFKSEFAARNAERTKNPQVVQRKKFHPNEREALPELLPEEEDFEELLPRLNIVDRCILYVAYLLVGRDEDAAVKKFLLLRRRFYGGGRSIARLPAVLLGLVFVLLLMIVFFFAGVLAPQVAKPHVALAYHQLKTITRSVAKELADLDIPELDLSGIKSIDQGVASELARWQGDSLKLSGLESIDSSVARELAGWKGKTLDLSGVQELTSTVAQAFKGWQGDLLRLNGVKSLDDDVAGTLKDFQGKSVELLGLVAVGESTFAILKVNPRIAVPRPVVPQRPSALPPANESMTSVTKSSPSPPPRKQPINEPEPFPSDLPRTITNSLGIKMNLIPAGKFTMGDAKGDRNETPHEVTLTQPFYLGVTEVTNAQWQSVMGTVPSNWKDADHPVEQVSLDDAVSFCEKLSAMPDERAAGREYRLPTEAEWEYACRAGTTTQYSFGDDASLLDDFAWFDGNANKQTHPVGQKKPNAWGLYDMHGNVIEWCSDWYGGYPSEVASDPLGPLMGSYRVYRGGSWSYDAGGCRSAIRLANDPSFRSFLRGFRLALSLPDTTPPTVSVKTPATPPPEPKPATATQTNESMTSVAKTSPSTPPSKQPINEPEPFPSDLPRTITNSLGIRMNLIPAGKFTMGEGNNAHEVTLTKPFYLGVTEVTNAQGKRLMGFTPSIWKEDDHPVQMVTWDEAVKFCEILSARPAEKATGRVYRLPTEAEWEYACRAETTTAYSFGDDESLLGDFGWFGSNSNGQTTHPVGQKQPNAWGLFDMYGNVSEWCSDWYGDYAGGAVTDPRGPSEGSNRVYRGGGWNPSAGGCRSADRYEDNPSGRFRHLGFRLALSPSGAKPPEAGK